MHLRAEKRSLIGRNKHEHLIGQISTWTHYFSPIKWSRLFRPIRELLARGKTPLQFFLAQGNSRLSRSNSPIAMKRDGNSKANNDENVAVESLSNT